MPARRLDRQPHAAMRLLRRGLCHIHAGPALFSDAAGATDPHWSDVVALLSFNGTEGQTTTVDSSTFANTVTLTTGTLNAAAAKFGATGVTVPPSTGLSFPSTNVLFGSADFTIEGWFYATTVDSTRRGVVSRTNGGGGASDIAWQVSHGNGEFRARMGVGGSLHTLTEASNVSANTWIHFALCRDGTTARLYRDGVQVASASIGSGALSNPTASVNLPQDPSFGSFIGYMDEYRFTRNICRYPSGTTFSPPSSAFPNS